MKRIAILNTGGTISMSEDQTTGKVSPSSTNPLSQEGNLFRSLADQNPFLRTRPRLPEIPMGKPRPMDGRTPIPRRTGMVVAKSGRFQRRPHAARQRSAAARPFRPTPASRSSENRFVRTKPQRRIPRRPLLPSRTATRQHPYLRNRTAQTRQAAPSPKRLGVGTHPRTMAACSRCRRRRLASQPRIKRTASA